MSRHLQSGMEPAGIVDAVCCVHFVAANRQRLLLAIVQDMGLTFLVPAEVCEEVKGKGAQYPGLKERWLRFQNSDLVEVLPGLEEATTDDPYLSAVVERFADLRQMPAPQALRRRKDRGEYVVVAHADVQQRAGRDVYVLMDDGDGQQLAADTIGEDRIIDLEVLLEHGHRASIAGLRTLPEVRTVWNDLRKYGVLAPWSQTRLLQSL